MRNVPEGEGQEPQRVGLKYSLENRQNYGGVPELTKERLRAALRTTVERVAAATAAGKKTKKSADELRRGLATTISELPPLLLDHAFHASGFDKTTTAAGVLEKENLLESLFVSLGQARTIVDSITSSSSCPGYIIAKTRDGVEPTAEASKRLLYEDFHPFRPKQYENDHALTILEFDTFNKTVDEFFSSVEGQRLQSKLSEREETAKRKLDATKRDHAKRIEGLQEAQSLNIRKAGAIEANVERVQEAMDAINGLLQQGMDWVNTGKLVEREQKRQNPVAEIIKLPLKLQENTITLLLAEEDVEEEEEDFAYETDSSTSDTEATGKQKAADRRLEVDINLGISPWGNARGYYDQKKVAADKEQKTVQQSDFALKNAEQKIQHDLKKGLKQEKPVLQPIRKQMWFEKFDWFVSSEGYLVLGGVDAQSNEILYRRYLRRGDVYVHADLHGAPSVIVKNNPKTPDAPIPPSTLAQAGNLAVCASSAWDSKAGMGAYWVNADQVSKTAPTGEFLPTGSFMVRGKKNFLMPAQLILGFGLMFKISEESKARHVKHRLHDVSEGDVVPDRSEPSETGAKGADNLDLVNLDADGQSSDEEEVGEAAEAPRENPLQPGADEGYMSDDGLDQPLASTLPDAVDDLQLEDAEDELRAAGGAGQTADQNEEPFEAAEDNEPAPESIASGSTAAPPSQKQVPAQQPKGQPKRGQRGKAKKIAAKYKDQDDEDRAAIEVLIGSAAGRQRAEAEAKAKDEREAAAAAATERRRAHQQRERQATKEHEEVRQLMLDEGVETLGDAELAASTPLDALVGTPLPGDEILEAIPVCAPWPALVRVKYKVKLQPGSVKKGKAVREIIERWKIEAGRKGVVDERSQDTERMWPREVELIKGLKPEEAFNSVPVGKVSVAMSGGAGGGKASGKGQPSKGGKGGKPGKQQKKK